MSNYKLIHDEEELKRFINFLPDLEKDETFYVCLFGRKKYYSEITSDKQQLKRFTSNKEFLIDKIKQLETEVGTYKHKGKPLPQEALALYIMPNPRHYGLASSKLINELSKDLYTGEYRNPRALSLNALQTSCKNKRFIDFDFDFNSEEEFSFLIFDLTENRYINRNALTLIQTRGGLHALVKLDLIDEEFKNSWYQDLSPSSDVKGDNLLPIPGCYQGGFIPKII